MKSKSTCVSNILVRFGWFGVGRVNVLLGNVQAAKSAFTTFLNVWESADDNLAQVVFAKNYLGEEN